MKALGSWVNKLAYVL
jgi:catechol 2,3-dioxygenase-like lactoylglutathione lyase family enzyme